VGASKWARGFFCSILFLFLGIKQAGAGGYYFYGFGDRAASLGYSFIGLADDATAIYWNPAGLTQLHQKQIRGGFWQMIQYNYKDRNHVSNTNINRLAQDMDPRRGDFLTAIYPEEPNYFRDDEMGTPLALMQDIEAAWQWKGYHFGAGFYTPLGTASSWQDRNRLPSQSLIDGRLWGNFFLAINNISVAKEILPGLSIGSGFNFLWGKMGQDGHKAFLDPDNPGRNYGYDYEAKGWGWGVEGVFGVLYQMSPQLQVGAVYRTGGTLKFTGENEERHTLLQIADKADFRWRLLNPPTWGIGIAFRPHPRLLIVADWQREDWTRARYNFNQHNHRSSRSFLLQDMDMDLNWHAIDDFRVGVEYKVAENFFLRAGHGWYPSPLPQDQAGIFTLSPVENVPTITAGFSYSTPGGWMFDFHLENHYEPEHNNTTHACIAYGFGISKRF